ncbi:MAG: lipoate--protein ligase family protein [Candidatus Sumerlaeota bacterium]|nr:lipoate--protein ligase family protein [Candidatus Sumerlaeota bacterium]
MRLLDLTLPAPAENLALEEALLEETEAGQGGETLRFWESGVFFVVMGAGCHASADANLERCAADGIAVLRRCSGGGTVLQGPGCLNCALILDARARRELSSIAETNTHVLGRLARALESVCPGLRREGISDLAVDGMKISGSAQKRKRRFILFHATLPHDFDPALVALYLREPARQPEYRAARPHARFMRNISAPPVRLKELITAEWDASAPPPKTPCAPPLERMRGLVDSKYARDAWNLMF